MIAVNPNPVITNAEVFASECHGDLDFMIKRLRKRLWKSGAMEEYKEKMRFSKPSVARHKDKLRRKWLISVRKDEQ